jgi:uncharacterized membrane protein
MNRYNSPTNDQSARKREVFIDIFRGFAVISMIITHIIAITYSGGSGTDQTVYNIGIAGGVLSFTAFLFVSGIGSYFSINREDNSFTRTKGFSRIVKILFIYYFLATLSIFVNTTLYSFPPTATWGENLLATIFFLIIPEFTEFLIPLILFSISIIFFKKFYRFLLSNPLAGIVLMVGSYALGTIVLNINLASPELNTLKAIFGGHNFETGQLHTFPVLQYFPIFLFGIYFGRFISENISKSRRIKISFIWLICFGALSFAAITSFRYFNLQLLNPLPDAGRFPPSISFIFLSLAAAFTVFVLLLLAYKFIPRILKVFLHYLGTNALEMMLFHTTILFAYKYFTTNLTNPNGIKHLYLSDVLILFVLVIIGSSLLTNLKNSIKKWSTKESQGEIVWWFFTERAVSTVIFIFIFGVVLTTIYRNSFANSVSADSSSIQFKKRLIREEDQWWNHEFRTFRAISVENKSSALPLFQGSWVGVRLNHEQALGTKNASSPEGKDLRVVYFDEEQGKYNELPLVVENLKSNNTLIAFKLSQGINPGEKSEKYFLYYGNDFTEDYPKSQDRFNSPPLEEGVTLGQENFHTILASTNRFWFLKKKSTAYQSAALIFDVTLNDPEISKDSIVTYTITGTSKNGSMKNAENNKYQAAVIVGDLEPGAYTIQANVTDSKNNLRITRSQKIPFNITYPLYVSWSQDWEGWDVDQRHLNDIANIADSYGVPMTHFFNPRIYVKNQYTTSKISEDRAKYITNWVKDRQKNRFEEIGMHIHMLGDMVSEAGVQAKTSPVVVGTYGFDVPSYSYSEADLKKVFEWGRLKLVENGLGSPISYRTGAWMSGVNVLQAAQKAGFLIDSSGRTGGPVNNAIPSSTPVPWDLAVTTRPYLPDLDNINTWNAPSNQRMKIWEFPNNGADSYWFSGSELISRFDQNYSKKGSVLNSPQVVTYLSHPHWFANVDTWKIRGLFDYTNQYLYKNDDGPVVYATLETIYAEWDREKFINGN